MTFAPPTTWIVEVGEPLPIDPGRPKRMRAALLSEQAALRGHRVTWWTSAFDHYRKTMRAVGSYHVDFDGGSYEIVTLPALGYQRHVSLRRFRDHRVTARAFSAQAGLRESPDVVCAALPTLDLADASARFCTERGVPLMVDIQDLWPDIFRRELPDLVRPLATPALIPFERMADRACRAATSIVAVCPPFVEWGLRRAGRDAGPFDAVFPLSTDPLAAEPDGEDAIERWWSAHGVSFELPIVAYVGSFTQQFSFEAVAAVAERWVTERPQCQFVLCGDGPDRQALVDRIGTLGNVIMPGWTNAPEATYLLRRSEIGVTPYRPNEDFESNWSNKVIEYLSVGLPIVTSLRRGATADLLREEHCGLTYDHTDPSSLAAALTALLEPATNAAAAANSARVFEDRFRADHVYGRYAELLEEVAHAK